jgi:flavin reductase (DIM6/NTAB) family NADH-FMN oxidoreductase RutF
MRRIFRLIRHGRSLAHWPIVFPNVHIGLRVHLRNTRGARVDITDAHVPISLRPLVIGVECLQAAYDGFGGTDDAGLSLVVSDASTGAELADVRLRSIGSIPTQGNELRLFEMGACRNRCASRLTRWWRYALAWRHALDAPRRGDRLCMSASDLRALNAYYIVPRPVYSVSVSHAGRTNMFPMDLVGRLPSGAFSLALRTTSPAIELIDSSRRVVMSGAPSHLLSEVYALGRHHRESAIDVGKLPFRIAQSRRYALPIIADASIVRELTVRAVHRIGSHTVFVCDIDEEIGEPQNMIAHTSAMFVEWLRRRGRTVEVLRPT